jgi:hypothetical protein
VSKILAKEDQKDIRIGKFTGDGDIPSHFGPEIQRILINEFKAKQINVSKEALIEIKGEYAPASQDPAEPASNIMFIRINAKLVNTKTRLDLQNVSLTSRAVYGNEALAKAFAPTVALPPDADLGRRNAILKEKIEKPSAHIDGSKVKSGAESPYAVELLVVSDPKAPNPIAGRTARIKDGCAFVDLKKNEYYRLRIHNQSDHDVAVKVSIDGLDQFVFSDPEFCEKGKPKFTYMTVLKKSTGDIDGWFRNLSKVDSFVITEYAKSAVAELNAAQGEIGQICVQFHASWNTDAEKPKDESGKDAATGRGPSIDTKLKPREPFVGALRDQVSIRYVK